MLLEDPVDSVLCAVCVYVHVCQLCCRLCWCVCVSPSLIIVDLWSFAGFILQEGSGSHNRTRRSLYTVPFHSQPLGGED